MNQELKDRVIRCLSDSLIALIDDLEISGSASAKQVNELYDLFQKLEDAQPNIVDKSHSAEEDQKIIDNYFKSKVRALGLKTKAEWELLQELGGEEHSNYIESLSIEAAKKEGMLSSVDQ